MKKKKGKFLDTKSEKGAILVMMAAALLVLFGIAALTVDIGMALNSYHALGKIADYVALAAIKKFATKTTNPIVSQIIDVAQKTAQQNSLPGQSAAPVVLTSDILPGIYDFNKRTFTEANQFSTKGVNSVKVTVRQAPGANSSVTFRLIQVLTHKNQTLSMNRTSVASFGKRYFVTALDISGSMDDLVDYDWNSAHCTTGTPTITDPNLRNFRCNPKPAYNNQECLGGRPQPATDVFRTTQQNLFTNSIFDSLYQLGFLAFDNTAKRLVDFGKDNNKKDVDNIITKIRNDWTTYRTSSGASPPLASMLAFPGGNDPICQAGRQSTTGFTGIGQAIHEARTMFSSLGPDPTAAKYLFLLTDGAPNCDAQGVCSNDATGQANGQSYATSEAASAKSENIVIIAIYFDTLKGVCNQKTDANFLYLLNNIAFGSSTAEKSDHTLCAADASGLAYLFSKLQLDPVVTLMPCDNCG